MAKCGWGGGGGGSWIFDVRCFFLVFLLGGGGLQISKQFTFFFECWCLM